MTMLGNNFQAVASNGMETANQYNTRQHTHRGSTRLTARLGLSHQMLHEDVTSSVRIVIIKQIT